MVMGIGSNWVELGRGLMGMGYVLVRKWMEKERENVTWAWAEGLDLEKRIIKTIVKIINNDN